MVKQYQPKRKAL